MNAKSTWGYRHWGLRRISLITLSKPVRKPTLANLTHFYQGHCQDTAELDQFFPMNNCTNSTSDSLEGECGPEWRWSSPKKEQTKAARKGEGNGVGWWCVCRALQFAALQANKSVVLDETGSIRDRPTHCDSSQWELKSIYYLGIYWFCQVLRVIVNNAAVSKE